MKKWLPLLSMSLTLGFSIDGFAQISFTNSSSLLHSDAGVAGSNANNRSGNAVCIVDVDHNGLDDIVKMDNNRYVRIEYQQPGGTFNYQYIGDFGTTNCWGMSAGDVDHNGYKDILFNGGSQAKLILLNNTGTGMLGSVINLPNGNIFSQNGSFCDVNNDGWLDIFMCNDVDESRLWINDGTGNFPSEQANSLINFNLTPGVGPGPALSGSSPNDQYDESGNYSNVFCDYDQDGDVDLYISHCRQGASAGDLRRTNVLFRNNGNGTYTGINQSSEIGTLASNDQDWTTSFGDIDNDGDFDAFMTKHNTTSGYYINQGAGVFSGVYGTLAFGGSQPQQSFFEDFDNDGYVDMLITGNAQQRLYRNNGDTTFTQVTNATLGFTGSFLSYAAGDLNHDGKIDLYTSYGSTYNSPSGTTDDVLWMNSTNNNNKFVTFVLTGATANKNAIGAKAYIYGTWGTQVREVRAGESYGTTNSFHLHFGLGQAAVIDSAYITFPSGNTTKLYNLNPNQFICVVENEPVLTNITTTPSGVVEMCDGDNVTISAPSGNNFTYLWSTGETTQSINVTTEGSYNVQIDNGQACVASSPAVLVDVNPEEFPSINALGVTEFCDGESVTLEATGGNQYLWNTSDTTSSIIASQAGTYFVSVQGLCQWWNSDTIAVTTLPNPAPAGNDITLIGFGDTIVSATGNSVSWFDAAVGGNFLGTGNDYPTGYLTTTTTFYAQAENPHGGGLDTVLCPNIANATYSTGTLNGYLMFDVLAACQLNAVDVSTDSAGTRIIELRDNTGMVLQSDTIYINAGTSTIVLNFALTPGTNYQLGTNTAQNNIEFGANSPYLKRNQNGATYPYSAPGFVSITSGNNGTNPTSGAYYYFYNWVVEELPEICYSALTPITVTVIDISGINEASENNALLIYPNPSNEFFNIAFDANNNSIAYIEVAEMTGRIVYQKNTTFTSGKNIIEISTMGWPAGIYQTTLRVDGTAHRSLVVVK
jgi:hypothetical protein